MTKFKFITLFAALAVFISCSEEEPVIEYVIVTETVVETQTQTVEVDPYALPAEYTNIFHEKMWVWYLDWDREKIMEFVDNF